MTSSAAEVSSHHAANSDDASSLGRTTKCTLNLMQALFPDDTIAVRIFARPGGQGHDLLPGIVEVSAEPTVDLLGIFLGLGWLTSSPAL